MAPSFLVAVVLGALQGIFEWLPISSEGNITVILTALGQQPGNAVSLALFLHLGTAVSATAYYRREIITVLSSVSEWWRGDTATAPLVFYFVATLVSGIVGIGSYALLQEVVSALTGGAVVIGIGILLVLMGVFQRVSAERETVTSPDPTVVDAVLVGAAQGIAILPGITRSGMTTGTLLLQGYDGPDAFRFSFVLSIPAAIGGGVLAAADSGLQGLTPTAAVAAFVTAAVIGYLSMDVLLRLVERVAFWAVCLGLGGVAIVGGLSVI
jgi:undecaprenyl-diphosphatase